MSNDIDDEKQKLISRRHSDTRLLRRDSTLDHIVDIDDDQYRELTADYPHYNRRDSGFSVRSNMTMAEEDAIEKLLRKISGASYHKFRNGLNNTPQLIKMDSNTRQTLKMEMIKYIEQLKGEYDHKIKEEKEAVMLKYRKEAKQWEDKYKILKREHKRKKLNYAQMSQRMDDKHIGGCKFWGWSLSALNASASSSSCNPKHCHPKRQQMKEMGLNEMGMLHHTTNVHKAKKRKTNNDKKVRFTMLKDNDEINANHQS